MTTNPPSATSDGLAAGESLREAEARIMQEWRWGNLTVLGVASHLRRAGFNLQTATDKANALSPPSAPGDVDLREALKAGDRLADCLTLRTHGSRDRDEGEVLASWDKLSFAAHAAPDGGRNG